MCARLILKVSLFTPTMAQRNGVKPLLISSHSISFVLSDFLTSTTSETNIQKSYHKKDFFVILYFKKKKKDDKRLFFK